MLKANSDQWYVGWFRWSCRVLDRHMGVDRGYRLVRYANGTNLCHFFRTIMWGSLISLASVAMWIYVAAVVLFMPFYLFPIASVLSTLAVIAGTLGAIFVVLVVIVGGITGYEHLKDVMQERRDRPEGQPEAPTTFLQVVWAHLVGIKKRFCPTISIKDTSDVP